MGAGYALQFVRIVLFVFFASFLLLRPHRFVAEALLTIDAEYDSAAEYKVVGMHQFREAKVAEFDRRGGASPMATGTRRIHPPRHENKWFTSFPMNSNSPYRFLSTSNAIRSLLVKIASHSNLEQDFLRNDY